MKYYQVITTVSDWHVYADSRQEAVDYVMKRTAGRAVILDVRRG